MVISLLTNTEILKAKRKGSAYQITDGRGTVSVGDTAGGSYGVGNAGTAAFKQMSFRGTLTWP
jgi:hypothetical protein